MPRRERRSSSKATTDQRSVRRERTVARQERRRHDLAVAMQRGDVDQAEAIARKIQASDHMSEIMAIRNENHDPDARRQRLGSLAERRDTEAWGAANAVPKLAVYDLGEPNLTMGFVGEPAGPREHATVVAASPSVIIAVDEQPKTRSRMAADYLTGRARAVAPDNREHPLRHAVILLPEGRGESAHAREQATARAALYLALAGADPATSDWVLVEHDGSTGRGQGRHWHLLWIDQGGAPGGHAIAAVAARTWAREYGDVEAAQACSMSTGVAARRDWQQLSAELPSRCAGLSRPVGTAEDAGGKWFCKGGWSAADAAAATEHIFGYDA